MIANDATGTAFLAGQAAARFVDSLDGATPLATAAVRAGLSEEQAKTLINQFLANGLVVLQGATALAPKPPKPIEGKLIFFRVNLLDVSGIVERVLPIARIFFSRWGFLAWCAVAIAAFFAVAAQPEAFDVALTGLMNLSLESGIILTVIFICLKVFHELGHASALRIFADREGVALGPIRAGISFFALFPFPFTDTTVAWNIESRMRRVVIGLAGIYVESWIAAVAALLWASVAPGDLQTILFQILLIAGFSTLLFNLNPLVRLDGYYIFSDIFGRPNMGTRSALAARLVGVWLLGGPKPQFDRFHLTYWVLSYAYRWVIFAGIFWLSYSVDPRLSWVVAAISIMTLVIRPVIATVKMRPKTRGNLVRPLATACVLAGVGLALFVPVSDTVHLDGHIVRYQQTVLRSDETAFVRAALAQGVVPDQTAAVDLWNPELMLRLQELEMDREIIDGKLRKHRANDPVKLDLFQAEHDRVLEQIEEVSGRLRSLNPGATPGAIWEPLDAELLQGAWIGVYQNRVLGNVSEASRPHIDVFVDQELSDLGLHLAMAETVEFRPVSAPGCVASGKVSALELAQRQGRAGFRFKVDLPPGTPCVESMPEGSGFVVRAARPDASVARQLYNAASRIAQNRLPQDMFQR